MSAPSKPRRAASRIGRATLGCIALALVAPSMAAEFETPAWLAAGTADEAMLARGETIAGEGIGGVPACVSCHGRYGDDSVPEAVPVLAAQHPEFLAKQLSDYRDGGRAHPVMGPLAKQLSPEDMLAVSAWYGAQEPAPERPGEPDPDRMARGSTLYVVGDEASRVPSCANCHGTLAEGLPPTLPRLSGQSADYIVAQFRAWREGTRASLSAGVMQRIAEALDDDDIEAVATFLQHYDTSR